MQVVTVMYPSGDGATFDQDYYMNKHMTLVRERWGSHGLSDTKVMRGVPGPDGAAPAYTVMTTLTFGSMDQFKAAAAQHGKEIFDDIPNFTNAKPTLQFNEPMG